MTLVQHGPRHVEVVLDQPARRNAIDDTLVAELAAALTAAEAVPECRAFVISARGEDFCAGMDLNTTQTGTGSSELPYWTLLRRLATTELVTVSVVDGAVSAGGVGITSACDVVLAGEAASFRLTEALFGLLPAMALPFVARRTGEHRAFTAALLTDDLDAAAAVTAGLADRAGPTARELLRPLLVGLRRVDRDTVAALKSYRATVFPWPGDLGETASRALLDRLAAPGVRETMAELKRVLAS